MRTSRRRPRDYHQPWRPWWSSGLPFLSSFSLLLALDLGVFHRKAHVVSVREALTWTCVWVALALAFSGFVYLGYEHHWLGLRDTPDPVDRSAALPDGRINDGWSAFLKFLTGYVVEKSLSVDNVFVIAMLFRYFAVPRMYQHRVLFWGILGAVAMRGADDRHRRTAGRRVLVGAVRLRRRPHPDRHQDGVLHR